MEADEFNVRLGLFTRITVWSMISVTASLAPSSPGRSMLFAAEFIKPHHLKIGFGDTLSKALDLRFPARTWRLWGKAGAIARISALNPHINDINHLQPGTVLDIGEFAAGELAAGEPLTYARDAAVELEGSCTSVEINSLSQESRAPASHATLVHDPEGRFGWFGIKPRFAYARLDLVDNASFGEASLLTDLTYGVGLEWGQHWSDSLQTSLNFAVRDEKYEFLSDTAILENRAHRLTAFGLNADLHPIPSNDRFSIGLGVNFEQRLFVRAGSSTVITMDKITIPSATAGFNYKFAELWPFSAAASGSYVYMLPGESTAFSIKAGSGYTLDGSIGMALSERLQMAGAVFYTDRTQNTSIATQRQFEVGFTLELKYRVNPPIFRHGDFEQ